MGKITDGARRQLKNNAADARNTARDALIELDIEKRRASEMRKAKGKRDQKKIDAIVKRIENAKKAEQKAERELKQQLKWAERKHAEIAKIEAQHDAEKDPKKRKALMAEIEKRFEEMGKQMLPLVETLLILRNLKNIVEQIRKDLNDVETSDLVC